MKVKQANGLSVEIIGPKELPKFCAIIPDRGDRPELTKFCLQQLDRMKVKPEKVYHINHRPDTERFDLISRVHKGISIARAEGFDWCFIIENDDSYPANYFERFLPFMDKNDFLGDEASTYYNLRNLTYRTFEHRYRSSLFTTAFKISALNNFDWPSDHSPFLDLDIWKYARFKRRFFIKTGAIGMKHQMGLCGGKGHQMRMQNIDTDLAWLQDHVDEMSFEFYCGLIEKFKEKVA